MRGGRISNGQDAGTPEFARRIPVRRRKSSSGFSLIETMMVVAIALVAMAMAVPSVINTVNTSKLRGQMSDLSAIVQICRSQAVQMNETKHLIFTTSGSQTLGYVDKPGSTLTMPTTTMPQTWLPASMANVAAPTTTPTPLNSTTMWGDGSGTVPITPSIGVNGGMDFNSSGIPCGPVSSTTAYCAGISNGYAFYFTLTSNPGGTRWAAVGISPAGRVKTFFWNGGAWSD
jgi:prepilin-type N-terminal cleavage/methylation domain-containing protein